MRKTYSTRLLLIVLLLGLAQSKLFATNASMLSTAQPERLQVTAYEALDEHELMKGQHDQHKRDTPDMSLTTRLVDKPIHSRYFGLHGAVSPAWRYPPALDYHRHVW